MTRQQYRKAFKVLLEEQGLDDIFTRKLMQEEDTGSVNDFFLKNDPCRWVSNAFDWDRRMWVDLDRSWQILINAYKAR